MPRIPRIEPAPTPQPTLRSAVPTADYGGLDTTGKALEQVADATARITNAYQRSQANLAFAEAQSKMLDLQASFTNDIDYDTQVQRFTSERQKILAEARKKLGDSNGYVREFDLRTGEMADRMKFQISQQANTGRIGRSRASLDLALERYEFSAGRAKTDEEREMIKNDALRDLIAARDDGVVTDEDMVNKGQAFLSHMEHSSVQRALRDDPADGLRRLFSGEWDLTQAQRDILIEQGHNEFMRVIRAKTRDSREQRAADKARRKELQSKTFAELLLKARPGREGVTEFDLEQAAENLDKEMIEHITNLVANGGFSRDAESNPFVANELIERAGAGDPDALEDAAHAVISGRLSSGDLEKVRTKSTIEQRYRHQFASLRRAMDVGAAVLPHRQLAIARHRAAQAEDQLLSAILEKPDMSQEEANRLKDAIVSSSLFVDLRETPKANAQIPKNLEDIKKFLQENAEDRDSKIIDQEEFLRLSRNLAEWETILKMRAAEAAGRQNP